MLTSGFNFIDSEFRVKIRFIFLLMFFGMRHLPQNGFTGVLWMAHGCMQAHRKVCKMPNAFCKKNNLPIKVTKKNKENILNSIKAFIALQVYDENTYFKIANQNDKFVIRAMELD